AAHHRARDRAEHLPRNRRAEGLGRVIPLTPAKPPAPVFERVAIVGFGLIGGSIGFAARARWPTSLVIAVDNKAVIEEAMRRGAADVGGDSLVMAGEADLVILAAPVLRNIALLRDLPEYLQRPAIVTDVGSTKRAIVGAARGEDGVALAGRGLSDTTRLASSPPDIWRDIASTNADQIGAALDVLIALLQELRGDLTVGNRLEEIFREAARWREKIPNP